MRRVRLASLLKGERGTAAALGAAGGASAASGRSGQRYPSTRSNTSYSSTGPSSASMAASSIINLPTATLNTLINQLYLEVYLRLTHAVRKMIPCQVTQQHSLVLVCGDIIVTLFVLYVA